MKKITDRQRDVFGLHGFSRSRVGKYGVMCDGCKKNISCPSVYWSDGKENFCSTCHRKAMEKKVAEMLGEIDQVYRKEIGQLRAEIREWKGCLDVADMDYLGIELPGGDIDSDYAHFTPDVMLQLLDKKDEEIDRLKSENERLDTLAYTPHSMTLYAAGTKDDPFRSFELKVIDVSVSDHGCTVESDELNAVIDRLRKELNGDEND